MDGQCAIGKGIEIGEDMRGGGMSVSEVRKDTVTERGRGNIVRTSNEVRSIAKS